MTWALAIVLGFLWWRWDCYRAREPRMKRSPLGRLGETDRR